MPRLTSTRKRGGGRRKGSRARSVVRARRQRGGSFIKKLWGFAKKANRFLRKTKLISRSAGVANKFGLPYADKVGKVAKMTGYGRKIRRRRRTRGGNLGGALKLSGAGSKKRLKGLPIMY